MRSLYRILSSLSIFSHFLVLLAMPCFAANAGYSLEEISEEKISDIVSSLNLSVVEESKLSVGFSCFDVNEEGSIALGFKSTNQNFIYVYDLNGIFQSGLSFIHDGDFGVMWDGENFLIYTARGNLAILCNQDAAILDIKATPNTAEYNSYWNKTVKANKRVVNGETYSASLYSLSNQHIHLGEYSTLTKTENSGNRTVLFDTANTAILRYAIFTLIIAIFILLIFSYIITGLIRQARQGKDTEPSPVL